MTTTNPHRSPATPEIPQHLRKLGRLMDESIRLPGGYRIGWDGIIGLIPGIGDAAGLAVSVYIIIAAARLGLGRGILLKMTANVILEALIGTIPVLGDFFDFTFKANVRNLKLLEKQLEQEHRAPK